EKKSDVEDPGERERLDVGGMKVHVEAVWSTANRRNSLKKKSWKWGRQKKENKKGLGARQKRKI
ncbi:hypothetical protein RUM43_012570, partial [Polyplax serrata]